tara:strand:+ start:631 stop:1719 length:1089 start_codon:yes stop_codon:yes gene_type:complete
MNIQNDIYHQIVNSMTFPLVIINLQKKITIINISGEDFLKTSSKMLIGKDICDFMPFSSPIINLIEKCINENSGFNEYGLDLSNPRIGIKKDINIQITPISNDRIMLIFIDNNFEKDFFSSSKESSGKTMSFLGSMLAHEVKNPLAGIRGAAQLIEKKGFEDKKLTNLICTEVDRIKGLVENIEVFDNLPFNDLNSLNIHSVIRHTCNVLKNSQKIELEIKEYFDPSIPEVIGNKDQLIQVFLNLMTNSCEAIRSNFHLKNEDYKGSIEIYTSYKHSSIVKADFSGERKNLPIEIRIKDNGCGIPEQFQKNIFEPFISSKKSSKGGLGLAMVAKIINDHNGIINFETSSEGTIFIINLASAG